MSDAEGGVIYVGHSGLHSSPDEFSLDSVFLIDANVALKILDYSKKTGRPYKGIGELVTSLRSRSGRVVFRRNSGFPVDLAMAALELSKQDKKEKYVKFHKYFEKMFFEIFPGSRYDQDWLQKKHRSAMRVVGSTKLSIERIVSKLYELIPSHGRVSDVDLFSRCRVLIDWLLRERDGLCIIPGPLLYIGVYAIAGSPDARKALKFSDYLKGRGAESAANVSWDMLYFIYQEMEYVFQSNTDTVVCTYDKTLSVLLSQKKKAGPRLQWPFFEFQEHISSFGELNEFRIERLNGKKIEVKIAELFADFWEVVDLVSDDSFRLGFDAVRARAKSRNALIRSTLGEER